MRLAKIVLVTGSLAVLTVLLTASILLAAGSRLLTDADERTATMTEKRDTEGQVSGGASANANETDANEIDANETDTTNATTEVATLAGGCFWCLEAAFEQLRGVTTVESGYTGGTVADPDYKQVCTGETGHAEVVQITFDPGEISYEQLLAVFFTIHDPTTLDRQGGDVGTQYRSAIYYHDERQQQAATGFITELSEAGIWPDPIVTEIVPLAEFYAAENYHQEYYQRNSSQPYCQAVINPKLAKLRAKFADKLK
jgi:peptide-methionine (S)-S-oxide reductase